MKEKERGKNETEKKKKKRSEKKSSKAGIEPATSYSVAGHRSLTHSYRLRDCTKPTDIYRKSQWR